MHTTFAITNDGKKIAYDRSGNGPPIILLHGGRQSRRKWHELGYVQRLAANHTVITIDIRGNGESDKPLLATDHTIDALCEDVLAVADACAIETFILCGYSYGGNIGRYLASSSARVSKFILIGNPFGLGAPGSFRQSIVGFHDHWAPLLASHSAETLDVQLLSPEDKGALASGMMPLALAWTSAMLEWPVNEPKDLRCPTLWIIGSNNDVAMASLEEYRAELETTQVSVEILDGLNHEQELLEVDRMFPLISENMS